MFHCEAFTSGGTNHERNTLLLSMIESTSRESLNFSKMKHVKHGMREREHMKDT